MKVPKCVEIMMNTIGRVYGIWKRVPEEFTLFRKIFTPVCIPNGQISDKVQDLLSILPISHNLDIGLLSHMHRYLMSSKISFLCFLIFTIWTIDVLVPFAQIFYELLALPSCLIFTLWTLTFPSIYTKSLFHLDWCLHSAQMSDEQKDSFPKCLQNLYISIFVLYTLTSYD